MVVGRHSRRQFGLGAAGALVCALAHPTMAGVAGADEAIDGAANAFSRATQVKDFALLLMRGEEVLYRKDFGAYGPNTAISIASATKWVTAGVVMSVWDQGKIDLDAPVRTYLPELPSPYGDLTLRLLMSFTAGLGTGLERRLERTMTLAEAAAKIATFPLSDPPGTAFVYGGPNLQVAGAVVERVTGKRWADYFREVLGDPLGMNPFYWSSPEADIPVEKVLNPMLQGGGYTTLDAYKPYLTMIAQKGLLQGRRYLSEAAIDEMDKVQTHGVTMKVVPKGPGENTQYSLAHWCEVEGPSGCTMLSSPGAFGVYPWVDRKLGLHGIIFLRDRLSRVAAEEHKLRAAMIAAVQ